jgi:5-bromo-4-chloroindolyl phosphate hydrolysis protein
VNAGKIDVDNVAAVPILLTAGWWMPAPSPSIKEIRMTKDKKSGLPRNSISLALAIGVYVLLSHFLGIGWLISVLAAITGFIICRTILKPRKIKEKEIVVETGGVSQAELNRVLEEGGKKINEMRSYGMRIKDAEVKRKVYAISEVVQKIYENFKKDPKDIKAAKQFLSYYFDAVIKILKGYVEMSEQSSLSDDARAALKKTESMLDSIKSAFETQLEKLLRDDVLDLDTEIKVLANMIKMEGLGEKVQK